LGKHRMSKALDLSERGHTSVEPLERFERNETLKPLEQLRRFKRG